MNAFWIILTGSLVAVTCGLLGCFLTLRKMAMIGDAISHAVLPGIVIAFLLSGKDSLPILIGAASFGLLTTFIIEYLQKTGKLQGDAAIGLTFTFLFALGVILIAIYADQIDLDQDCVLHGEIAYVPFDTIITKGGLNLGPSAVWILGTVFLLVLAMIIIGYKGLFAGIVAATGGYFLAVWIDGSIAGAMTVVLGLEFLITFIFAPRYGLLLNR